jgi:hypothetical protein
VNLVPLIGVSPGKRASSDRQSLTRSRLPDTYPHDAQLDYFRIAIRE